MVFTDDKETGWLPGVVKTSDGMVCFTKVRGKNKDGEPIFWRYGVYHTLFEEVGEEASLEYIKENFHLLD